jgi:hypothetical protein
MLYTPNLNSFQEYCAQILRTIDVLDARIKTAPGDPSHRVIKSLLTIDLELTQECFAAQLKRDAAHRITVGEEPRHAA